MADQVDIWSFWKQFEIKAKNYWRLIGYGWHIAVIAVPLLILWIYFWPHPKTVQHINVEKGATINNITMEEKPWEAGLFGGAGRYDNKDAYFGGLMIKRKF